MSGRPDRESIGPRFESWWAHQRNNHRGIVSRRIPSLSTPTVRLPSSQRTSNAANKTQTKWPRETAHVPRHESMQDRPSNRRRIRETLYANACPTLIQYVELLSCTCSRVANFGRSMLCVAHAVREPYRTLLLNRQDPIALGRLAPGTNHPLDLALRGRDSKASVGLVSLIWSQAPRHIWCTPTPFLAENSAAALKLPSKASAWMSAKDIAICGSPWFQSDGFVLGSIRTADRLRPRCIPCSCQSQTACGSL